MSRLDGRVRTHQLVIAVARAEARREMSPHATFIASNISHPSETLAATTSW
jgi:hypothetical protein